MKKTALFLALSLGLLAPMYSQQGQGKGTQTNNNNSTNKTDSQTENTEEDTLPRFWEVKFSDGGDFMTALDRIVSISKSQYLLDGNLIVNEVTIDSGGRSLARFYHIAPVGDSGSGDAKSAIASHAISRAQSLVQEGADRTGIDVHNMAQKNYPTTTHTGMIEYRVLDLGDIDAIYKSVQTAWQTGKGKKLTIK